MSTTLEPTRESVLQRALDQVDAARRGERHHSRLPIADLVLRTPSETGGGGYTITGHAATTNSDYTLFESEGVRVRERIAANAFDRVLSGNPDVHLNINHDMSKAIARTGVQGMGGLELTMDPQGLRVYARVDPSDPDVQSLAAKMPLGIMDQMSFAFTISNERRTSNETGDSIDVVYEILEVGQLYDVCVCAQGANPQTDSSIRSLAAVGLQASAWATHRQQAESLGGVSVSGEEPGVLESTRVRVAKAKATARTKRATYST